MQLSLQENSAKNKEAVPYFVRIENQYATLDLSRTLHIPVSTTHIDDTLFYVAEACGHQVRSQNLDKIVPLVGQLIQGLTISNRLPNYVFISRYSRNIHLVYTLGHEVAVYVSGGPSFRHIELARVRQYLRDYLQRTGLLGPPNRPDKLHVRGIHRKTLALIRPVFYFKKRVGDEEASFWAPVFLSEEDNQIFTFAADSKKRWGAPVEGRGQIFTFAADAKRVASLDEGKEILSLHQIVTKALMEDSRLTDPYDLQPDRLFPEHWFQLEANLTRLEDTITVADKALPVYVKDNLYIAVENRLDGQGAVENRYSLHFARSLESLNQRVVANSTYQD